MPILFALDFDATIVEEDSDYYILKTLAPQLQLELKEGSQRKEQWTDLCDRMVGRLHELKYSPDQITAAIRSIPFNPAMEQALGLARQNGSVLIISDANTVYIDEIAREKGFHNHVSAVITNPGVFDCEGRLHISRHTTKDAHSCSRCPINLCKGRELGRFIENKDFKICVYAGDGSNDFCPSSTLRSTDYVLPRKGYAFSKLLQDPKNRAEIKAKVIEWETADDVLVIFKDIIDKECYGGVRDL
jgi:pyridoxal phosphate phosphatase PHOSPHO2